MKDRVKEENYSKSLPIEIPLCCGRKKENSSTLGEGDTPENDIPEYAFSVGSYNPKKTAVPLLKLNFRKKPSSSDEEPVGNRSEAEGHNDDDVQNDMKKPASGHKNLLENEDEISIYSDDDILENRSEVSSLLGDQRELSIYSDDDLFFGDLEL